MVLFQHLIKTGGTTRCRHLQAEMGSRFYDLDLQGYKDLPPGVTTVMGHVLRCAVGSKCIVFVRHPADWLVSIYNHNVARKGPYWDRPFEHWYDWAGKDAVYCYDGPQRDRMCAWMDRAFGASFGAIDNAFFVGNQENMQYDFGILCRWLGIADVPKRSYRISGEYDDIDGKVIPKHYVLTPEMRARIEAENERDMALYGFAQERRGATVRALLTELALRRQ